MTTTHDFSDGKGPVPAHQHCNGGGWVAATALVEDTCYVGPDASVADHARLYDNARMCDNTSLSSHASMGGDAIASRTPLSLQLGRFPVTISDSHVTIGCTTDTIHGWRTGQDLSRDPPPSSASLPGAYEARSRWGAACGSPSDDQGRR